MPASAAAKVPDGLDLVAVATIPLNGLTAAQAVDHLGAAQDRSLLVTGGAGAVGGHAAAIASCAGFRVSVFARPSDGECVRSVGAIELLTRLPREPRFEAVVHAAVIGTPVLDALIDGGGTSA